MTRFHGIFQFLLAFIVENYKEEDVEEEDNKGIEEIEGGYQYTYRNQVNLRKEGY